MSTENSGKFTLTTLCYVESGDKYLMLHRVKKKNDMNHDKYIGIGGHVEADESPLECIIREAREETGLVLKNPELRGIITFLIDDYREVSFLYTCNDFSGTLKECNEGDLEWIPREKVGELPLWKGDLVFFDLLNSGAPVFDLKLTYVHDVLTAAEVDGKKIKI